MLSPLCWIRAALHARTLLPLTRWRVNTGRHLACICCETMRKPSPISSSLITCADVLHKAGWWRRVSPLWWVSVEIVLMPLIGRTKGALNMYLLISTMARTSPLRFSGATCNASRLPCWAYHLIWACISLNLLLLLRTDQKVDNHALQSLMP